MAKIGGKRMLFRVKSSTTEDGKIVYSVLSCADDVEHRRHRRNPFDIKYVQAVLSSFETIGETGNLGSLSRSEVEAASTNVHVRMELIKTMKENLAKITSEAVKHYRGAQRKEGQKDNSVNVGEKKPEYSVAGGSSVLECQRDTFFCCDIYDLYLSKFGSYFEKLQGKTKKYGNLTSKPGTERTSHEHETIPLDLHTAVHMLENHAKDNPNLLRDGDLCFDLDKEVTETLESYMRFEPAEALPLEINFDREADIKPFQKYIKTVTKELTLDASGSDTEEELQEVDLVPQEDQQSICTSVSEKVDQNIVSCRAESILQSEYVLDSIPHVDQSSTLNSRENCNFVGSLLEQEMNVQVPCKCSRTGVLNSSLQRTPCADLEVKTGRSNRHTEPSIVEHFIFPEQVENHKFSQGSRQADNARGINWEAKHSEDTDSIEEFADDSMENSILEKVNDNAANEPESSNFAECPAVLETADTNSNWNISEFKEACKFGQLQDLSNQNGNQTSGKFGIFLNPKDLFKFHHAKVKQSRKKVQWLVNDVEKLLDSIEPFDDTSNNEDAQESVLPNIVVGPKMFLASLSRPLLNLVEHYKQLQENPLKIPGALHFAPIAGDYEDFDFAEVDDLVVKDIKETGQFLNNQNLHKSSFEDPIPTSRKHCHKASIPGANWDDIPWSSKATVSEIDINPDLPIDEIVDSEADKRKMLNQSTHVQDFLGRESREPENCCGPNKYANDTSDTKSCEHSVLTQVCDILNCPTLETAYVNSGQDDSLLEELADQLNEHSKGGLGVEGLNEDCVDETIECSEEPVGNKIASVVIKHSEEQSGDQIGISFGKVVVQTAGNAEEKSSSQVQISNDVSCGNLPSSDLFETAREDKFDNQVHNIQKQRKRYRLDDLIADVVMAECQFHQQILYHFDLAPLSSSLATGISSLHHGEHLTSISFRQLLEASKVGTNGHENGAITIQRSFMALLSLAHQQNISSFKGPFIEGYQIHLEASSSGYLRDIMIHLEPFLEKKDGSNVFAPHVNKV